MPTRIIMYTYLIIKAKDCDQGLSFFSAAIKLVKYLAILLSLSRLFQNFALPKGKYFWIRLSYTPLMLANNVILKVNFNFLLKSNR